MEETILVLHVIIAVAIVGLVLMQRSEGGGLGMGGGGGGGGMGSFMSARGTANLLTRATAIAAALFFLSSLTLSIIMSQRSEPASIVDSIASDEQATVPAAEETEPSVPAAE